MNFYRKYLLIAIIIVVFLSQVSAQVTLEDIFTKNKFHTKGVWNFYFMNDGQRYCKLENNTNLSNIIAYDLSSGNISDTIFLGTNLIPKDSSTAIDFDDFNFSTDEKQILFSTNTEHIYRRSSTATYFIWNIETKRLSSLSTQPEQRLATFSPDGNKIAFVSNNNLFYKELTTGKETQVTIDGKFNEIINGATDWVYEEEFGFSQAFFWSPDSRKIAFYRFDESHVKQFTMPIYNDLYPEQYTFKYPKVGEDNAYVTIHIYDLKNNSITNIDIGTEKDQYIPRIKWTQDPNILSLQRMNRHQNKLELLLADALSGKSKVILTEESKTYVDVSNDLTFLKNNSQFLWTSEKSGFNHIYLYDISGKQIAQITKGDWEMRNLYGIDEANNIIYYLASEISPLEKQVYKINIDGSSKTIITPENGTHTAHFNKTFTYFLHNYANANTPDKISLLNSNGEIIRILEDNEELKNKLDKNFFSKKEFFTLITSEKIQLNGWMLKPKNFNTKQKYPVLMYLYGGPGSQTVTDDWGAASREYWFQYLVSKGFIVVSVDNRGTGGRGVDFKNITYMNLGKHETKDQIEAAKYLKSLKYIDGNNISIFGWSYGGYMASMCILQGADVFKSAIAVAPVTDWKFYDTIYTERYMRTSKENEEGYRNSAPLHYADKLKGKYLLIHGTADDNVHFQNSIEMITALTNANKQFDLMIYPDKAHGISGKVTQMNLYTKMSQFLFDNL